MLEHQPTAVDRLMVLTPSPVGVEFLILTASTALLDMEMIALIILVHGPTAPVAPDDGQASSVNFDSHRLLNVHVPPASTTLHEQAFRVRRRRELHNLLNLLSNWDGPPRTRVDTREPGKMTLIVRRDCGNIANGGRKNRLRRKDRVAI